MATRAVLDGCSLTCKTLSQLGVKGSAVTISDAAMKRVLEARSVVQGLVDRGFHEGHVAYGINTGFGLFSDVVIDHTKLQILQNNLIRSHSAGVGAPLSREETRRLLALRCRRVIGGRNGFEVWLRKQSPTDLTFLIG